MTGAYIAVVSDRVLSLGFGAKGEPAGVLPELSVNGSAVASAAAAATVPRCQGKFFDAGQGTKSI